MTVQQQQQESAEVKKLKEEKARLVKQMRDLRAKEADVNSELLKAGVDVSLIAYW